MTQSYPLLWPEGWPRTPSAQQCGSQFKTDYDRARRNLIRQLDLLGASNVVVSSNLPVRQDGFPYADAARRKITDPGVAIYFTLRDKPLSMARDRYWTVAENIHSLGHAVEAIRAIERHGGQYMMERAFTGFMALPSNSPWEILGLKPGSSSTEVEAAYREKAKRWHPDAGGSHEQMAKLNAARTELAGKTG